MTICDVDGDAITSITNPTPANVESYFNTSMTNCINSIPSNRRSRAYIFLGK